MLEIKHSQWCRLEECKQKTKFRCIKCNLYFCINIKTIVLETFIRNNLVSLDKIKKIYLLFCNFQKAYLIVLRNFHFDVTLTQCPFQ